MKTVPAALQTHLDSELATLAICIKVVATDGTTIGITNHAENLTFGGMTYYSAYGHTPTTIAQSGGLEVDNLETRAILDNATFTRTHILGGKWDHATVTVYLVNWAN